MNLIFVNKIGTNWRGEHIFEFLFSDNIENVSGEEWDSYPASGNPQPPDESITKEVGVLTSKLMLDVIQNSESFCMDDAIDGILALAWENIEGYDKYPDTRLGFHYGEEKESVVDKLYEKDYILEFKK